MLTAPTPTEPIDDPERARIVAAARVLYLQQGIVAVSMADIGRHLRMPEHAVRRWFGEGKTLLVAAVVEAHGHFIQAELAGHKELCTTAVEELLLLRNWVSGEMRVSLSPFFRQLAAGYPECELRWRGFMASFPVAHLRNNLHWGVGQGFYHPQLDVEQRVADWFGAVRPLDAPEATGLEAGEAHRALMAAFLASIVTPAGALVARRLQEAAPFY